MSTVKLIIESATTFYNQLKNDSNGRYRSWEYCYKVFHDARNDDEPDYDFLSLHLAFYLASWGMYRASSFLLQKDYKVHLPVVKEILKSKYDALLGIEYGAYRSKSNQRILGELSSFLKQYYAEQRATVKGSDIKNDLSATLITKVLMGTLGCVPAYDRYFIAGVKDQEVTSGIYGIKSILRLVDFYERNSVQFEEARRNLIVCDDLLYPQMKLLDMGFWQIGFEKEESQN